MIWESGYWKSDLIKDADILNKWSKKKPSNRQYVLFEKKIFIAAFAIRKLLEAEKTFSGTFNLRIDPDLHARLSTKAKAAGLSLNSYIAEKLNQ